MRHTPLAGWQGRMRSPCQQSASCLKPGALSGKAELRVTAIRCIHGHANCRVSIDWKYASAAIPPGVMTDMPFQLDAPGIYKVQPCSFWTKACSEPPGIMAGHQRLSLSLLSLVFAS